MSESVAIIENQAQAAEPELTQTELIENEPLVEEVSIDGMCGVY